MSTSKERQGPVCKDAKKNSAQKKLMTGAAVIILLFAITFFTSGYAEDGESLSEILIKATNPIPGTEDTVSAGFFGDLVDKIMSLIIGDTTEEVSDGALTDNDGGMDRMSELVNAYTEVQDEKSGPVFEEFSAKYCSELPVGEGNELNESLQKIYSAEKIEDLVEEGETVDSFFAKLKVRTLYEGFYYELFPKKDTGVGLFVFNNKIYKMATPDFVEKNGHYGYSGSSRKYSSDFEGDLLFWKSEEFEWSNVGEFDKYSKIIDLGAEGQILYKTAELDDYEDAIVCGPAKMDGHAITANGFGSVKTTHMLIRQETDEPAEDTDA